MNSEEKDKLNKYFMAPSVNDEDVIISAFADDTNEESLREIAKEHWENASSVHVDLGHVLRKIITTTGAKSHSGGSRISRMLHVYYRAAAILIVPLLIASVYFAIRQHGQAEIYATIAAPGGSRIQFTLPDGSAGHLNGGSTLRYPALFSGKRTVFLSGEGYFDVISDKKRPFTVETSHASVTATGTRFDVCAYPGYEETITTLEDGVVQVFNKIANTGVSLSPGEQNRIYNSDGKMDTREVRTQLYTSWKENMLRFDNAPLAEVMQKMERRYGVKIIVKDDMPVPHNFTLTVKTESLREMLQLLSLTAPIRYTADKDTVFITIAQRE